MAKNYKNDIEKEPNVIGPDIREDLYKETLSNSSPFPNPLNYEDIDKEFKRWVDKDLDISYDGRKIETFMLMSNQRFSEFMQSWENVDENGNLFLHFKTISRDLNPKGGTLYGENKNIPGDRFYTMKRIRTFDDAGRPYYVSYKMKQPYTIDLSYKVSIITDKIEVLNNFNNKINDKFKAIQCYIRPNGHYLSMKLEDISDESENSIDNRRFYMQSFKIKVQGYIINQEDFKVEESPELKFLGVDIDLKNKEFCMTSIDEDDDDGVEIVSKIKNGIKKYSYHIDIDFNINEIITKDIIDLKLFINDSEVKTCIYENKLYSIIEYNKLGEIIKKEPIDINVFENDEIKFRNIVIKNDANIGEVIIKGIKKTD